MPFFAPHQKRSPRPKRRTSCPPFCRSGTRFFPLAKRRAGYLNFYPSLRWYAACAASLLQSASFSAWRLTEEDFGFFAFSSPSVQELQRAFVRLCSVLRGCRAEGMLDLPCPPSALALLKDPQELVLLFSLARLADAKGQSILPALLETARAFHRLCRQPARPVARLPFDHSAGQRFIWPVPRGCKKRCSRPICCLKRF